MKKEVPSIAALSWGFRQLGQHLGLLIPLSVLFFAPEISARAGFEWPMVFAQVFKTGFFFVLLLKAMKLTKPEGAKAPQGSTSAFVRGEILKLLAVSAGAVAGAAMFALWLKWRNPDLLVSMLQVIIKREAPQELLRLWEILPYWEQGLTALMLLGLPLYAHVLFNFFGYVLADHGGKAIDSLRASARLSRGVMWQLAWFYSLSLALLVLGFKLFIVGAIFTFPATVLATVYVYRELDQRRDDA